jgi:hypothetical protein
MRICQPRVPKRTVLSANAILRENGTNRVNAWWRRDRSVDPAVPAGLNCFLLSEYVELWHAQSWGEKRSIGR